MKKMILSTITTVTILISSLSYANVETEQDLIIEKGLADATYGNIDAPALKALMYAHIPFVLLDARGRWWSIPTIIPGAIFASYEYTPDELQSIIPDYDSLIAVYCYSSTCPLANGLIDKLVKLGYQNIVKYPGGLVEWRDIANYPVDTFE